MLGLFIWAKFCTVDVSSVLLAPIKMPTREEKKVSATTWHVYLARTPKLESHKIRLEKACPEARATSITYRSLGNAVVELRWQRAVKHENVCKFISTHALAEGFSVRPQIAPAAVSVAQGASLGDSATASTGAVVGSGAIANVDSTAGISTCSASSSKLAKGQNDSAHSESVPVVSRLPLCCMPLKLAALCSASDKEISRTGFTVNWNRKLGEGTFAKVFEGLQNGTQAPLAIKAFEADRHAEYDAMHEVCAMSAFQPHPHLPMLLDVGRINGRICLATPRYDKNLHEVIKMRAFEQVELTYILRCICDGVAHLHGAGLCHLDLKPQNILLRMGPLPPADRGPTAEFARWLLNLPDSVAVCVSDLGNALLGDSTQRPIRSEKQVTDHGVGVVTLWYRAPELLFGNAAFSVSSDMWSLGCVAAEMGCRSPLFPGTNEIDTSMKIFRMFGKPPDELSERISGRKQPLLARALPSFVAESWPPCWLQQDWSPEFIDFLAQVLQVDPACRLSAGDALLHRLFQPPQMVTAMSAVSAGRGLATIQQKKLEPHLLAWLQADPRWTEVSVDFRQARTSDLKYEESGHVRATPPETKFINKQDASKPCRSRRLGRFMQEFLRCNRNWLIRLTMLVRKELQKCPSHFLGRNGAEFLSHCFSDTAFAYSTIQVMKLGQREDGKHYDGGASLLHMGITIFGSRNLECWHGDGTSHTLQQSPGSIYVGNMCAVEHQVAHVDDASDLHCSPADPMQGVKIAVMIRSDVFSQSRARRMSGKPTPTDVFDIVNNVIAQHLASEPITLPSFTQVAGEVSAPDNESLDAGEACLRRKKKQRAK